MSDIWQPETYAKFLDLRTRAAKDLLFAIDESFKPQRVYDLGCGPGNSTILLKQRWPEAIITGIDNSQDMLSEAKKKYPRLEFMTGDIANFNPTEKPDCIFANASLQWLDQHEALIPKLLELLPIGGVLAIQIPNNFHYASHQITLDLLEKNKNWQHLVAALQNTLRYGRLEKPFYDPTWYYDLYSAAKVAHVQLWETNYIQEMPNHEAILNWMQGTGLRPILSQLDLAQQAEFEKLYVAELKNSYPLQKNGKVLFPFRRFFMVSIK